MRDLTLLCAAVAALLLACGGALDAGPTPAPSEVAAALEPPPAPAEAAPPAEVAAPVTAVDAAALPTLHPVARAGSALACAEDTQHEALCALLDTSRRGVDRAALDRMLAAGANLDCACAFIKTRTKVAAKIPIVQDFVKKKTRTLTWSELPLSLAFDIEDGGTAVRWLLEHGADPALSVEGTPLIDRALAANNREAVRLLLAAGVAPAAADLAACRDVAMIDLMLAQGADPAGIDLAVALEAREADALQRYLALGVKPGALDGDAVVRRGDLEATRMLLDAGMRQDQTGFQGQSILSLFAERGDLAHVALLLDRGADPNHRSDLFGVTPLYNALSGAGDLAVIERLLKAKANPNAKIPYGDGVLLQWAIDERHAEPIPLLVQYGARFTPPSGETALQYATRTGAGEAVIAALQR